jgi:hypothetical protein
MRIMEDMARVTPTTYLLRNIDPALWRKVKAQAARDGISVRDAILRFLVVYARPAVPR